MKRIFTIISLFAFMAVAMPLKAATGPTSIRVAPPAPKFSDAERQSELARRRAAVAAKMADKSVLILFSAEPRLYTNDVDYVYRQENNLYYLTALKQDGATFVMTKDGGNVTETLFLPKRVPLREAWEGRMYSREQAMNISGLKNLVDSSERDAFFQSLKEKKAFASKDGTASISTGAETIYLLLPEGPQDRDGMREFAVENTFSKDLSGYKVENAQPIFAQLRHIKSPYEMKILQHAVDISNEAHMRAMATVGRANWEYEVHAEVEYTFRRRNADFWGYPSIVGCGPNATTLHYVESQSPVKKGELLLLDVGAEYDHYTADVTRTFPVNGKFSKEQAEIYQIIYDSQEAVAKATKPGTTFGNLSAASRGVIQTGLAKLGLIPAADAKVQMLFNDQLMEVPASSVWNIHGLGHWLGMNVHDVGDYGAPLKAGMVYTNEPGIYIREDALANLPDTPLNRAFIEKVQPLFEKYKNIGVRIEDDMVVTETGVEWMTKNLPRSTADIEAFMAVAPKQVTLSERIRNNPARVLFDHTFAIR
ncbi:MAG: aminopeptidase P family protein [Chloracidobacterium sp.]|nr:aminopeptidase P family protein [Chloracidobacterium sp.]